VQLKTLIPATAAVTAAAIVGGLASRPADSPWYRSLRKPPYQPPRQAFPIVWPMLYADIAIVSSNVLDEMERRGHQGERREYMTALMVNLLLNTGWSWLFFNRRRLGTSAIVAAVLAGSGTDLTRRAVAFQGKRATPLALYPIWCAFATLLSGHVWILNRRRATLSSIAREFPTTRRRRWCPYTVRVLNCGEFSDLWPCPATSSVT
jgi:tryptophan-rich sensory protein